MWLALQRTTNHSVSPTQYPQHPVNPSFLPDRSLEPVEKKTRNWFIPNSFYRYQRNSKRTPRDCILLLKYKQVDSPAISSIFKNIIMWQLNSYYFKCSYGHEKYIRRNGDKKLRIKYYLEKIIKEIKVFI